MSRRVGNRVFWNPKSEKICDNGPIEAKEHLGLNQQYKPSADKAEVNHFYGFAEPQIMEICGIKERR